MLNRIERQLPSLSPVQRRIGQWIMAHPRQAADAKLAEVARETGASEPSVIRFCRRVGLAGFRELGLRLVEALSRPDSHVHRSISLDDAPTDAASKVVEASIQSLVEVHSQLSAMPVEEAVDAMRTARQIIFAGLGASGNVAMDARQKFFRLGIPCSVVTDAPGLLQMAAIADADDVFVIASHSGSWPELRRAADLATANGAIAIALTNPNSPLAEAATIVFAGRIQEDASVYTPMGSRLAQLALLDALHVSLALSIGDHAVSRLRQTKLALAHRRI